ncbi:MAG: TlpA family protein disulfide reductase [Bdellovibrionales bacterium]|nr:TlpA family protein disulfide reductase [Bdellovibrionales bacterium]
MSKFQTDLQAESARHPYVKRLNLVLGIVVVLILAVSGYYKSGYRASMDNPPANGAKRAPDFTLNRADGKAVKLSDWKDEIVVVHFWASWCPPCLPEIPEILGAAKKLPKDKSGRAIHWLLVSQDQTWEKAHSVVKEETLPENVTLVLDPEAKVSDAFGSYQFPETYLVLRDGGLAAKWIGAQEWSGKWGDSVLEGIESASRFNSLPKAPGT